MTMKKQQCIMISIEFLTNSDTNTNIETSTNPINDMLIVDAGAVAIRLYAATLGDSYWMLHPLTGAFCQCSAGIL